MLREFVCFTLLALIPGLLTDSELGKCRTVKDTMLTCLEATVEDLPNEKMQSVTWLLFVRSSVPVVGKKTMKLFPALTDLHASNANVQTIEEDAFEGLADLNWVDFSYNKISKIDSNLFSKAKSFYYLNMSGNPDLVIPKNKPFLNSAKLNWLDISASNIKEVYPETFKMLKGLKVLSMAKNELKTLPKGVFAPLTNLYSLDLSSNRFRALNADLFKDLKHLSLYLGRNPWECNCSLYPFIEWAKTRRLKDEVRCAKPSDKPWSDVTGAGCGGELVEVF